MKVTAVPAPITNKTIKKATGIPTDNPIINPKFDPPSPSKTQKRKRYQQTPRKGRGRRNQT